MTHRLLACMGLQALRPFLRRASTGAAGLRRMLRDAADRQQRRDQDGGDDKSSDGAECYHAQAFGKGRTSQPGAFPRSSAAIHAGA